jgi:hypothetical protein
LTFPEEGWNVFEVRSSFLFLKYGRRNDKRITRDQAAFSGLLARHPPAPQFDPGGLPSLRMTSTLLTIWLPKQYSSMVQIEVQKDDPEVAITDAHSSSYATDPYFLTTQFKIIESYRILTNVIVTLHLDEKLAQQNGAARWTIDDTYEYLKNRVSVEQTRMTSLIEISVRNTDPQMAADIANRVADLTGSSAWIHGRKLNTGASKRWKRNWLVRRMNFTRPKLNWTEYETI